MLEHPEQHQGLPGCHPRSSTGQSWHPVPAHLLCVDTHWYSSAALASYEYTPQETRDRTLYKALVRLRGHTVCSRKHIFVGICWLQEQTRLPTCGSRYVEDSRILDLEALALQRTAPACYTLHHTSVHSRSQCMRPIRLYTKTQVSSKKVLARI